MPDFSYERARGGAVAGVDEVGRGPWAGPVVAGAVILNPQMIPVGLNDSKKLSALRRERLAFEIERVADCALGWASVGEIDQLNIRDASLLAMRRAVCNLPRRATFALIDGNTVPPDLPCEATALVKGDTRSLSIAAASIVAKVARDRLMKGLALMHPGYGWETNKGYGTKIHAEALQDLGVTAHHRRSFAPVHNMLYKSG